MELIVTFVSVVVSWAVLRKRNTSIKKYHKNAKINFTEVQEKIYGNAWHNCTKAHALYLQCYSVCLTKVTENETDIAEGDCSNL